MSTAIAIFFLYYILAAPKIHAALPTPSDPDPANVQTQALNRTAPSSYSSPPATIPAFPEQAAASSCPLDLPEDLFTAVKSACGSHRHHSDQNSYTNPLHHSRCCPVLAAWLYSAYSETVLRVTANTPPRTTSFDMPVLPDDSETCVDTLEKALGNRGTLLARPNETCDVVYCYCGIRLHPFSCPEAFSVNSVGDLEGGEAVKQLESDCYGGDGDVGGLEVCSKCLNSLYSLNGEKSGRINITGRTEKMHHRDCELMGITWLLNKNRSAYIHSASDVLRTMMMNDDDDSSDPTVCSLDSDGMPLAVDSSEINNQSSSTILATTTSLPQYLLVLSLFLCAIVDLHSFSR